MTMRVAIFSSKQHCLAFFDRLDAGRRHLDFRPKRPDASPAPIARGAQAFCLFVQTPNPP